MSEKSLDPVGGLPGQSWKRVFAKKLFGGKRNAFVRLPKHES